MPERRPATLSSPSRRTSRGAERASLCFLIYLRLGPDRTLASLAEVLSDAGCPTSLSTLKRYSRAFDWQRLLLDADASAARERHARAVDTLAAQAARQAQLGRVLQTLAARAAELRLRDPDGLKGVSLPAIARAGLAGSEMERRALGEQRDREGATAEMWERIIQQLVPAFLKVNALPDEDERVESFVEEVDRLVDAHIREVRERSEQ